MFIKASVVIFVVGIAWSNGAPGAPYSKVFLERDVVPVGYYQYGPPELPNAHFTEIASAPIQIALPTTSGVISPCGSSCVVPNQAPSIVAPLAPNPNVLTYKSSIANVPVIVTPTKNEPTGYEYSYVVYDENTGDHKAQRELSDGSVVRGEYAFLQPDGYVREVQYVADDVKGFNAIVKKFLPVTVEGKMNVEVVEKKDSGIPCHEVKNESIKDVSVEESNGIPMEKLSKLKAHHEQNHEEESIAETKRKSGENSKETKENSEDSEENSKSGKSADESEESKEKSLEKHDKQDVNTSKAIPKGKSEDTHEKQSKSEKESEEEHKAPIKELKDTSEESQEMFHLKKGSKKSSEEKSNDQHKYTSKTESGAESEEKSNEEFEKIKERLSQTHTKQVAEHGQEMVEPGPESVVSYNDIIRCIQSAVNKLNEAPGPHREESSPLTYIILNKPC